MSSKARAIGKEIAKEAGQPQVKTKDMLVRIDCRLQAGTNTPVEKSTYMLITGIPEDLPTEYEETVLKTAEKQFAQALNSRLYLEFYNLGKDAKDEQPCFLNLSRVDAVQVINVEKVK